MYHFIVSTQGTAHGLAVYHDKPSARDHYENAPLPEGQVRYLYQGNFTLGKYGLVTTYGKDYLLASQCGTD